MARIRTIKPEFWDSPDTARASLRARLLYIAMWNWADDWGIGSANPKQLAAFAFPNDDDFSASELPTLAKEVSDCFGVVLYEVNRRPYYCIPSWDEHQRTERKARRVNPPPPEGITAGQSVASELPTVSVGNTDDSEGKHKDGIGEQGNRGRKETCEPASRFGEFYDLYPRHIGRGQAERAWKAATKKADADTIIDGLRAQLPLLTSADPNFVKHPSTWLNGECWADEHETASDAAAEGQAMYGRLTERSF